MIRVYRSDPHAHSVAASDDPYSSHFVMVNHLSSGVQVRNVFKQQLDCRSTSTFPSRPFTLFKMLNPAGGGLCQKENIVRVRAEGEQFLLQAKDDHIRPLPKFITLPRRRRRRRIVPTPSGTTPGRVNRVAGRELGAAVVDGMIAEAEASNSRNNRNTDSAAWGKRVGITWRICLLKNSLLSTCWLFLGDVGRLGG
ncbi:hypothetical protein H4Q26_014459 [Puccinia striiformis f. sp. tritici PST-130]|nr:hypothetical protein H4Q26_014459 [Puccinia striiformis f. sp. tritici PST-130]